MSTKNQVIKTNYKTIALVAVTAFVVVFATTSSILNYAYGYDFKNSTAYNEVMNKTKEAANFTEGRTADLYIKDVQNQTMGVI